jgi:hypothetical protein
MACRDFRVESAFGDKTEVGFQARQGGFLRKAAIRRCSGRPRIRIGLRIARSRPKPGWVERSDAHRVSLQGDGFRKRSTHLTGYRCHRNPPPFRSSSGWRQAHSIPAAQRTEAGGRHVSLSHCLAGALGAFCISGELLGSAFGASWAAALYCLQ